jgi:hypothetical protein
MPGGKIVHWTGSFKIKRSRSNVFFDFNPNIEKHKWLDVGDSIKVPRGVEVTVKCLLNGEENGKEFEVTDRENWVVSNFCSRIVPMTAEHFTATHLGTPEKLVIARIAIPPSNTNFEISRHPDTNFHSFRVDWDTSLYAGDQLKVPQGQNVWVICQHNNQKVKVPNNGIPWAVTMACPSR